MRCLLLFLPSLLVLLCLPIPSQSLHPLVTVLTSFFTINILDSTLNSTLSISTRTTNNNQQIGSIESWLNSTLTFAQTALLDSQPWLNSTLVSNHIDHSFVLLNNHLDEKSQKIRTKINKTTSALSNSTINQLEQIIKSIASRFLTQDSAKAVHTILQILRSFPSKGIGFDVVGKYPLRDVLKSILAISHLHRSLGPPLPITTYRPLSSVKGSRELEILASGITRYATFASAAYGWKASLAFSRRIHKSDLATVLHKTGLNSSDIIYHTFSDGAQTTKPVFYVALDRERRNVVLCVRGTLSGRDVLTDLCCEGEEFEPIPASTSTSATSRTKGWLSRKKKRGKTLEAHQGILNSARKVSDLALPIIQEQLCQNPGYSLVVCGHSLGAGTACVLGGLWGDLFPNPKKFKVYAYGTPCISPESHCEDKGWGSVVNVINKGDPFASLSLGHIADATQGIKRLCDEPLKCQGVFSRLADDEDLNDLDKSWCQGLLTDIREGMNSSKLCPPGQIFEMDSSYTTTSQCKLRRVHYSKYRELKFQRRMLDLRRHIPNVYERDFGF